MSKRYAVAKNGTQRAALPRGRWDRGSGVLLRKLGRVKKCALGSRHGGYALVIGLLGNTCKGSNVYSPQRAFKVEYVSKHDRDFLAAGLLRVYNVLVVFFGPDLAERVLCVLQLQRVGDASWRPR